MQYTSHKIRLIMKVSLDIHNQPPVNLLIPRIQIIISQNITNKISTSGHDLLRGSLKRQYIGLIFNRNSNLHLKVTPSNFGKHSYFYTCSQHNRSPNWFIQCEGQLLHK